MGFLTICPICRGDFKDGRAYIGTSGVAFPLGHQLYPYCDGGLHLSCLQGWPLREEFSRGYYTQWQDYYENIGTVLAKNSTWFLACGPAPRLGTPYYAEVITADWPFRLKSDWNKRTQYVESDYQLPFEGPALDYAQSIMKQVAQTAPTIESLERLRSSIFDEVRSNNSFKPT